MIINIYYKQYQTYWTYAFWGGIPESCHFKHFNAHMTVINIQYLSFLLRVHHWSFDYFTFGLSPMNTNCSKKHIITTTNGDFYMNTYMATVLGKVPDFSRGFNSNYSHSNLLENQLLTGFLSCLTCTSPVYLRRWHSKIIICN